MMIYGGISLNYDWRTLVISPRQTNIDQHYEDSDLNESIPLGRESTLISVVLIARSMAEYVTYLSIVHGSMVADLQIGDIYYKNVTASEQSPANPLRPKLDMWKIQAQFRANTPVPFWVSNDEPVHQ